MAHGEIWEEHKIYASCQQEAIAVHDSLYPQHEFRIAMEVPPRKHRNRKHPCGNPA
jgi:hypothetical protein